MQETSDTGEREKECSNAYDNYYIDNTELTRRTLKVLHDFQREMSRECHLQDVSANQEIDGLDSTFLDHNINELDSLNDSIKENGVNLNERNSPKTCYLESMQEFFAPTKSLTVSSLFEVFSTSSTPEEKVILLHPMDILFKSDPQGNIPQLMSGESNPGTSRLKILIHLYSEKFSGESVDEIHRKSIISEIMHTLEVSWRSRFILYDQLVDDQVAYGKILPSEIAAIFVRNLFLTVKMEKCQRSSSLITNNVLSSKRILSRYLSTVEKSSLASKNIVKISKSKTFPTERVSEFVEEEPILSFPQHKAAVEALKLKRRRREIMARVTRQRSFTTTNKPASYPDTWHHPPS